MEPFLGQIQTFGFNYAPQYWEKCEGQILQITDNNALYALLGIKYGGDGRTTFALPDLRDANSPLETPCIATRGIFPSRY